MNKFFFLLSPFTIFAVMLSPNDIEIRKVSSKRELKKFIRFNYEINKHSPYAVPELYEDMLTTFSEKNAAMEFCEADYFMAFRKGKMVGRIAAIINHRANETWNKKSVRFGWIDFVDDEAVSAALIETVKVWGRERGMTTIEGPLGFTDMDPEGMLTFGYDRLSTMSTTYNYPYYPVHMERLGMEKAVDWVEREVTVPARTSGTHIEKYFRVAEISAQRYDLHVRKIKRLSELDTDNYGRRVFDIVNKAYAGLYGFSKMTERQIDHYIKTYLHFIDLRFLTIVETAQGEPIAMGVGMPSLSRALQKARGKLFPFGWLHLLKSIKFKHEPVIDLLLVAVLPVYQNKGVNAMLFADLIPIAQQMGFKTGETHPQLETNDKSQGQWAYLETEVHKRRRCYRQSLTDNTNKTDNA